jgi:hypothetical protein
MALFVQSFIIRDWAFSVLFGGNTGRDPLFLQAVPEPISVITSIRKKMFGCWKVTQQLSGPGVVRHLACRQMHQHRPAMTIANRMKL